MADARDASIIADVARAMPHTRRTIDGEDQTIAELERIVAFDGDPVGEATGGAYRLHRRLAQMASPGRRRPCSTARCAPLEPRRLRRWSPGDWEINLVDPRRSALKQAFSLSAFAALGDLASRTCCDKKIVQGELVQLRPGAQVPLEGCVDVTDSPREERHGALPPRAPRDLRRRTPDGVRPCIGRSQATGMSAPDDHARSADGGAWQDAGCAHSFVVERRPRLAVVQRRPVVTTSRVRLCPQAARSTVLFRRRFP
ncbi:transposase [Streptomyces sp. Ru62]|uniref:IS110 family transposase n=1 Tax=Streptomyces sp. Ru62 TaxID=2080745 RepID=UPI0035BBD0F9